MRIVIALMPKKGCNTRRLSWSVCRAKGPNPYTVPQLAHRVSQPPGPPGLPIRDAGNDAAEPPAGDTDGRADQRAEPRRQHHQSDHIPESIERWTKPYHTHQEHKTNQGFQGVAHRH